DNSAPDTQNTDNPFDGATAGGENSSTTQDNNSDSQTALFVIENWSVKSKMVSYGYGKPYIETSYDLYFPSIIPDSWRYIMNLKLDGEQIIKNTNSKLISVDRKNRKRMNCNFKLPDNKSDGTYKLELTVEVSEKIQSISTYITIEGNSVHQKGNNNSNNNNQKPDPQKDHTSEGEAVVWNGGSSENNNNSGGGYQPQPKTNANSQTNIPPNAFLVGTISNSGNKQGVYKAVELKKLMTYDRIVFKLISGKLEYIQLIWRKEGGSWETEYQGNKTDFNISKGLKNIPKNTTHLNFVVNAQHNRWSANDKACKMEVYLIPRAGGSGSSNFYTLMDEADLAFAINYWEVEQGPTNSSNPKQKSLDLLRKAARLINSEADFKKRLDMVNRLVSSSAVYVERINAFTVKQPFLELAGKTLHQFSSTISSAKRSGNYSAADAYSSAAEMWRSLTSAAWLGEHPYNKMYCYEQEKKYRALGGN
ncbi:MAG: hypothetical protein GQ527_12525, partial [Bacteroidales bacterium]|nr:hypothetical protein [Bacteroidales bacterium]